MKRKLLALLLAGGVTAATLVVPAIPVAAAEGDKTIYAVSQTHLDTVWSWDLEETVGKFIPNTMQSNFDLIELFDDYEFNFEGAYRYKLMEEYYPEQFEKLKEYAAEGKWNPAGSGLENGDVNSPSPEALFRNFLYGNNYFEDTLGVRNKDIFLPDCFGFGFALPSIAAHSNLLGFFTQKLSWGNTFAGEKLPFDVGMWYGPDGKGIIANINGNNYTNAYDNGMLADTDVLARLNRSPFNKNTTIFGIYGDRGGSPTYAAVKKLSAEMAGSSSASTKLQFASTDQMFKDMTQVDINKMLANGDQYTGELLLHTHGAGGYTSRAITKRWNRRAELIGDAAERSLTASDYLGASEYPAEKLEEIWTNVIAHQFHDDMPGTSNSTIYKRSWNEYMVDIKQFAAEYESGVSGVASMMDTSVLEGVPVVVNNPVAAARASTVNVTVTLAGAPAFVKVFDDAGAEVASQIVSKDGTTYEIAFTASVGSMGYRKYNVRPSATKSTIVNDKLTATTSTLSNEKYTVKLNANGDIFSIIDKSLNNKELLKNPITLGQFDNNENIYWASWEISSKDYAFQVPDRIVTDSTPTIAVLEDGPARVSLKIEREHRNSKYSQIVSLEAGGNIVAVDNVVDWQERATLMKAVFDLTSENPVATYDLGLGAIERGNNSQSNTSTGAENKSEVPHQKWADLSATNGSYGVSILNDSKIGIDKYNNSTLRLSLIHTPRNDFSHEYGYGPAGQSVQEVGENRFSYAVYGHTGTFGQSDVQIEAEAFNQPMNAFQTVSHTGSLGGHYSFGEISNNKVLIRAVKKAERSDEIVVRFNEGAGAEQKGVKFSLGTGIATAREIYASEEAVTGAANPTINASGELVFDIGKYGVKSYAITLKNPVNKAAGGKSAFVDLSSHYNIDAYSSNSNKADGGLNLLGDCYPSELISDELYAAGISYKTGDKIDGKNNAIKAAGQTITLPTGGFTTLKILAASIKGDKDATFKAGSKNVTLNIGDYSENVAAWDLFDLEQKGYVKEQTPAVWATHRHTAGKDRIAASTYMFSYELDVTGASAITLPNDSDIIIFAATVVDDANSKLFSVSSLHDERERDTTPPVVDIPQTYENGFETGDQAVVTNQGGHNVMDVDWTVDYSTDPVNSANKAIKFSGKDKSENGQWGSFAYVKALTLAQPIKVLNGMKLSYDIYVVDNLGKYVGLDMSFDTGSPLRDSKTGNSDASDTNGNRMHPSYPNTDKTGEWVTVECDLYKWAEGRSIKDIFFAYDHKTDTGDFTAYIDNIKLYMAEVSDPVDVILDKVAKVDRSLYTSESLAQLDKTKTILNNVVADSKATGIEREVALSVLQGAYDNLIIIKKPYAGIPAVSMDKQIGGIGIDRDGNGLPNNLGGILNESRAQFKNINFGLKGTDKIKVYYSGWDTGTDANIDIRLGSISGEIIGNIKVPQTTSGLPVDWSVYQWTGDVTLSKTLTGNQEIYLCFNTSAGKSHACNLKEIKFTERTERAALESGTYTLNKTDSKINVSGEVSVAEFKKNFNQTVKVLDNNGNEVVSGNIIAGMSVVTEDLAETYAITKQAEIEHTDLTAKTYKIDKVNNSVKGVLMSTGISDFKADFNQDVNVYDKNGNEVKTGGVIQKGMTVKTLDGKETYEIWIKGDVNNDGEVDVADMMAIRNVLIGSVTVSATIARSDVNLDGERDSADMLATRNIIMGVK